jgi:hypothetical protein
MTSPLISTAVPQTQISYAFGSITASYTLAGSFPKTVVFLVFISTLDAAVQVSFDGTNDHIAIPAGSTTPVYFPINFKTNNMTMAPCNIFVKRIGTPGAGNLFVSAFSSAIP